MLTAYLHLDYILFKAAVTAHSYQNLCIHAEYEI